MIDYTEQPQSQTTSLPGTLTPADIYKFAWAQANQPGAQALNNLQNILAMLKIAREAQAAEAQGLAARSAIAALSPGAQKWNVNMAGAPGQFAWQERNLADRPDLIPWMQDQDAGADRAYGRLLRAWGAPNVGIGYKGSQSTAYRDPSSPIGRIATADPSVFEGLAPWQRESLFRQTLTPNYDTNRDPHMLEWVNKIRARRTADVTENYYDVQQDGGYM